MSTLKEIAALFNLASSAPKKEVLFNRIRDSPHVTKVSDTEFEYRQPKMATAMVSGAKIPTWILLTPEEVPPVAGIDMGTGASLGFFGPTNRDNAVAAMQSNFLTSPEDRVKRPTVGPKKPTKKRTANDDPPATREDGHPSDFCRKQLPHVSLARPKDFFDTQITPKFLSWATDAMNLRAYSSGAGRGEYQDFMPFDLAEVYKMIGVLFANGLTPKPQFDYWFKLQDQEPLLGSNLISKALDRKNSATGKTVKAIRRWQHFRRFFTLQDYRENQKQQQKLNPLWKVQRLLDELNKQAKDMWVPGDFCGHR